MFLISITSTPGLYKNINFLSYLNYLSQDKKIETQGAFGYCSLRKKATIHQVTTMLSTSKNALFPGHNYLLTTGADDLTL